MTYKKHWQDLFDYYKKDPTIVSRLPYKELEAITSRVLFNKRNLEQHIQHCRSDCRKELEHHKSNIKKHESALIKKEILYNERLSAQYDEVESYWKKIEYGPADRCDIKVTLYRRAIGQWMHDLPKLHTGLWSPQARINYVNGKHNLNTEEHYHSLSATAGRLTLQDARAKRVNYNVDDYLRSTYRYTHVNWTTKEENNILGKYHDSRQRQMVSPEESYKACGISPLIYIKQEPTIMALAWRLILEDWGVDYSEIAHPFIDVISLKTAEEMYPELKETTTPNERINTPVVENMTVEATLEEK